MTNLFAHVELSTDDAKAARKFYKKVCPSWKLTDMKSPSGTYTVIDVAAQGPGKRLAAGGGIQAKMMPNAPTGWMPYISVTNLAKSLAVAKKLGAKIVMPAEDIGMGMIAIFVDPTGAFCGLWEPAPAKKPAKKSAAKKKSKK